jgi:hypothetical protein
MTQAEYAAFAAAQGDRIVASKTCHWRAVRPFFHRPLLVCTEHKPDSLSPPPHSFLGGYQYALTPGSCGNSQLNLLIFETPADYEIGSLNWSKRKQIKIAERDFKITPIQESEAFVKQAFPVYLSFYERTRYEYRADRRRPEVFAKWAETLFQFPKVRILGAFRAGRLGAVSISQFVEGQLLYSTVFCDDESLRLHVTGFMLHRVRQAAASTPGIQSIFAGAYKYAAARGVDEFYLARGCSLVRKPAILRLSPIAALFLKQLMPARYSEMRGDQVVCGLPGLASEGQTLGSSSSKPSPTAPTRPKNEPSNPVNH